MSKAPLAPLRIVADANIPHVYELFGWFGEVVRLPGHALDYRAAAGADVLLVRSVTQVDASVLDRSRVRFVGSATIGTDHVDLSLLQERGIAFAHAPGSNADSVVEYVTAALLAVFAARGEPLRGRTVGVVGCGHIGGRLAERLPALGCHVLCNDPPLAEAAGGGHQYHALADILGAADVITLHPPLERFGPYPTYHLIGDAELGRMRPGAWLVNASRGAVVENAALLRALAAGRLAGAILDVWEGEPTPNPALVAACSIATPHIAGYSYDGKVQGALMLADALARWLGVEPEPAGEALLAAEPVPDLRTPSVDLAETAWLDALVRQAYDVRADDAQMRAYLTSPPRDRAELFQHLRRTYPPRRSFMRHRVTGTVPGAYEEAVVDGLGMHLG
jgi:erythronate-4-phosphate dehydrogenase